MSAEHPIIDDPDLGAFARATTELSDGTVLTHDWYAGTIEADDGAVELMLEGTSADAARLLLPRMRAAVAELATLRRTASDAVVSAFSQGEPEQYELDDAVSDLVLDAIEAATDGTVVLHFTDSCAAHFPEGYWPAVHLAEDGTVSRVTVES